MNPGNPRAIHELEYPELPKAKLNLHVPLKDSLYSKCLLYFLTRRTHVGVTQLMFLALADISVLLGQANAQLRERNFARAFC